MTYNAAVQAEEKHQAIKITRQQLSMSRATAHRWLAKAQVFGLIVSYQGDHVPKRARWTSHGSSWMACAACKQPWPCLKAKTGERRT